MADLFDVLIADGEVGIERLVAERTQESVSLDFKLKSDPENGRFSETDKKVLAKALSAFANSAGGVLVWGIDGRKEKGDTVDCARDAVPITDIEAFKSEANTLLGHLLQPKHDGIKVEAILSAKAHGGPRDLRRVLDHVARELSPCECHSHFNSAAAASSPPPPTAAPWLHRQRGSTALIKSLARAHRWKMVLESGRYPSVAELAAAGKINPSYVSRILRLTLLAPDIIEAVVEGRQADGLEAVLLRPFHPIGELMCELLD